MLLAMEKLLAERRSMTLAELAIHFDTEPSALEPMLATLERKGRIRKIDPRGDRCARRCAGCVKACGPEMVVYRWEGSAVDSAGGQK